MSEGEWDNNLWDVKWRFPKVTKFDHFVQYIHSSLSIMMFSSWDGEYQDLASPPSSIVQWQLRALKPAMR